MFQKFTVLASLVLSATCMVLHQNPVPVLFSLQYDHNPHYNFAYEVNDAHTGDIKSQHESRRDDTVLGQYSLLQPDGIQRTVDYRANDYTGFQATVNNERVHTNGNRNGKTDGHNNVMSRPSPAANLPNLGNLEAGQAYQMWPAPTASHPAPTQAALAPMPLAISRSSFTQTISHGPEPAPQYNHNLWA